MTKETLAEQIVNIKKGQITTIVYRSRVRLAKKDADKELIKVSTFQGMLGDYYNRKAVKEAHENGSMGYGKGYFDEELIEDILYRKGEDIYLRFLPIESKTKKAVYYLNGEIVPIEELEKMFAPSYLHHSGRPSNETCLSLKAENIVSIA